MKQFLKTIKAKAKKHPKRIVFPEGHEPRIQKAAQILLKEKTAIPVLIGNPETMPKVLRERCEIINPKTDKRTEKLAKQYANLRKIEESKALEMVQTNINVLGTLLVHANEVDGMISGTTFPTADTIRPALQIIKPKEKFHKVSGFFFMILEKRILLFADCAITIEPNAHELADIAIDTAETAKKFGITPKIAMLSFSTAGSANHPFVDKVRQATQMVKHRRPDLLIEGEMQVDAALVPAICSRKFPSSSACGEFNVLIFPDLQSGNIAYKLVERLAKAHAIGPILQGLPKPINDLSRGCSVQDIVDLAAFTSVEAATHES